MLNQQDDFIDKRETNHLRRVSSTPRNRRPHPLAPGGRDAVSIRANVKSAGLFDEGCLRVCSVRRPRSAHERLITPHALYLMKTCRRLRHDDTYDKCSKRVGVSYTSVPIWIESGPNWYLKHCAGLTPLLKTRPHISYPTTSLKLLH